MANVFATKTHSERTCRAACRKCRVRMGAAPRPRERAARRWPSDRTGEVACIFSTPRRPATRRLSGIRVPQCIYQGLTTSFSIYSGQPTIKGTGKDRQVLPSSVPDDEFDWTVFGGFSPLLINLAAANDANTSPSSPSFSRLRFSGVWSSRMDRRSGTHGRRSRDARPLAQYL